MRFLVIGSLMAAACMAAPSAAQPRYDDRYEQPDDGYDDRDIADLDAAQRRFDAAQARFDREQRLYDDERRAFEDARSRYGADRERLAYRGDTWEGRDGQVYCRRPDGTTGTIVGGVAGGLLGRAIDGGRRRGVGTILGAGAGALLGRGIERNSDAACR